MKQLTEEFDQIVNQRRSTRIYDKQAEFDSSAVTRSIERAHLSPNSSNLQLWQFYHIKSEEAKAKIAEYCLGQPAATTANELVVFVTRADLWKERANWNIDHVIRSFGLSEEEKNALLKGKSKPTGNLLKGIGGDKEQRLKGVMNYYGKMIPQLYKGDKLGISGWIKKLVVAVKMAPKGPTYREVLKQDIRVIAHKSCALAAQTFMLSMSAEGYATCPMEGMDSKRISDYLKLPKGAEVCMVVSCGVPKPEGIYGQRLRVPIQEVLIEK